jgi:hypothetical protein
MITYAERVQAQRLGLRQRATSQPSPKPELLTEKDIMDITSALQEKHGLKFKDIPPKEIFKKTANENIRELQAKQKESLTVAQVFATFLYAIWPYVAGGIRTVVLQNPGDLVGAPDLNPYNGSAPIDGLKTYLGDDSLGLIENKNDRELELNGVGSTLVNGINEDLFESFFQPTQPNPFEIPELKPPFAED